jgi:hypothetical protein
MKKLFSLPVFFVFALFFSACSQAIQTPQPDRKTPMYESIADYETRQMVEAAGLQRISRLTGSQPEDITLLSSQKTEWDNTCLNLPNEGEPCTTEPVKGFTLFYQNFGHIYEVHSDKAAQNIRVTQTMTEFLSPTDLAIKMLTAQLQIPTDQILMQTVEEVVWRDSCLEIRSAQVCVPVDIPGFRIVLEAKETRFEFHSNLDGSLILGGNNLETSSNPLFTWQTNDPICQLAVFTENGMGFRVCNESEYVITPLSAEQAGQLLTFITTYAPFSVSTPYGEITLNGLGSAAALEVDQNMIGNWAKDQVAAYLQQSGQNETLLADYVSLSMQRTYAKDGASSRLIITNDYYLSGSNVEGVTVNDKALASEQIVKMSEWKNLYRTQSFLIWNPSEEWEAEITFYGLGTADIPEDVQQEILIFAIGVYAFLFPDEFICKNC